jgi:hypothetical protein
MWALTRWRLSMSREMEEKYSILKEWGGFYVSRM